MKRKVFAFLLCFVLVMAMPITARADMGPKPSVRIEFTGIQGETYYGTLLSLRDSTGPASAWKGNPEYARSHPGDEDYDIWLKFVEYQDTDGYYFLQEWWDCSETNQLNWTYYPPTPFKILLYFPETDTFYVSPVYERYAFDSYFTVDLSAYDTDPIMASKSYDYTWEIISLIARIHENRPEVVASFYNKEQQKFMKAMRTFPSVIRTEYAYALLVENDPSKAAKAMEAFEKVAKTYPYPNDINSERELIQIADEKVSA